MNFNILFHYTSLDFQQQLYHASEDMIIFHENSKIWSQDGIVKSTPMGAFTHNLKKCSLKMLSHTTSTTT